MKAWSLNKKSREIPRHLKHNATEIQWKFRTATARHDVTNEEQLKRVDQKEHYLVKSSPAKSHITAHESR